MQFRDIYAQSRKLSLNVLNFARFLHSQILRGRCPLKVVPALSPPSSSTSSNMLHFKAIFDSPLKKIIRGTPSLVGGALVRLGHSLARVKIWGRSTPRGRNTVFQKMRFKGVRFNIEISKVTGPNFTRLVSPNAGGIAVDGMTI